MSREDDVLTMISVRDAIQTQAEEAHRQMTQIAQAARDGQIDQPSSLAMDCMVTAGKLSALAGKGRAVSTQYLEYNAQSSGDMAGQLAVQALLEACLTADQQSENLQDVAVSLRELAIARKQTESAQAAAALVEKLT